MSSTTTPSSQSQPQPRQHHTYLYKILSTTPSDPTIPLAPLTPTPTTSDNTTTTTTFTLAPNTTLPATPLDLTSRYIHLSTAAQIPGTLTRFFPSPATQHTRILLLKCPRSAFESPSPSTSTITTTTTTTNNSAGAVLRWETPNGTIGIEGDENVFPHVYFADRRLGLRAEEVGEVRVVESGVGEEGWMEALGRVGEGWLV